MNLEQFIYWATTPKRSLANFSGGFSGECVSLISQYLALVFGLKPGAWGNAVDYWTKTRPEILAHFDKYQTRAFKDGDILVWGDDLGNITGPFGHIAIFYKNKIVNQNYNNQKFITLNDFFEPGFLGVLRPKNQTILTQKVVTPEKSSFDYYEIRAGDTFWGLEIRYNIKNGTLQQLNPGIDPRKLQIGQRIKIPAGKKTDEKGIEQYYQIAKGDTFWALENAWQLKHGTLQQLNPGIDPRKLQIGQRIKIR